MLVVVNKISDVVISDLMSVYAQAFDEGRTVRQDFREDLSDFFRVPGASLFILSENGRYISALRAELYLDGVLFSNLETLPTERNKGFAKKLIHYAMQHMISGGASRIYSHVGKRNAASLSVHFANQFEIYKDYAKLLDGTISQNYYTLLYKNTAG